MKYSRFEELPVWKAAIEVAVQTYHLTSRPVFKSRYSLRDQIERAAVSISNTSLKALNAGRHRSF